MILVNIKNLKTTDIEGRAVGKQSKREIAGIKAVKTENDRSNVDGSISTIRAVGSVASHLGSG